MLLICLSWEACKVSRRGPKMSFLFHCWNASRSIPFLVFWFTSFHPGLWNNAHGFVTGNPTPVGWLLARKWLDLICLLSCKRRERERERDPSLCSIKIGVRHIISEIDVGNRGETYDIRLLVTKNNIWLVVWNIFIFPYIGNVIIPIDFHIFQRGGPTTNQTWFPVL